MIICYLDESGNTGRKLGDPDQPFHVLAAVMVREDRIQEMSQQLDDLAARAPTREKLIEYHGQELFGGSGVWEGLRLGKGSISNLDLSPSWPMWMQVSPTPPSTSKADALAVDRSKRQPGSAPSSGTRP